MRNSSGFVCLLSVIISFTTRVPTEFVSVCSRYGNSEGGEIAEMLSYLWLFYSVCDEPSSNSRGRINHFCTMS